VGDDDMARADARGGDRGDRILDSGGEERCRWRRNRKARRAFFGERLVFDGVGRKL